MKERPIIFSGPMVRAILEGHKTQTRRILKPQPTDIPAPFHPEPRGDHWVWIARDDFPGYSFATGDFRCPFGIAGDKLWVREAHHFPKSFDHITASRIEKASVDAGYKKAWCPTQFAVGEIRKNWDPYFSSPEPTEPGKLRSPIHMPRWASRITLEITGLRVQQVQDISEEDALEEGALESGMPYVGAMTCDQSRIAFSLLWDSIHGHGAWESNDWVFALSFRRVQP